MVILGPERRAHWAAAGILFAVFGGGMALGFALDRGVVEPGVTSETSSEGDVERPLNSDLAPSGWIIDRLGLSESQRLSVDSVVAYHGALLTDLQREYRPRFNAVIRGAEQGLREVLTEDQRIRYDSLEAAQRAHRQSRNGTRR